MECILRFVEMHRYKTAWFVTSFSTKLQIVLNIEATLHINMVQKALFDPHPDLIPISNLP